MILVRFVYSRALSVYSLKVITPNDRHTYSMVITFKESLLVFFGGII